MPVIVNRPGPWTHRDLTAGGTRFHVALAGPEESPSTTDAGGLITAGPAEPLVLLVHGFPECWWTWRHVIGPLAEAGYRVAAADLRGFGGSDRPPSGYDLVTLAQDIAAVVRSLGHERAVVIGAGLGGQVAWALPHVAPDLTRAIEALGYPTLQTALGDDAPLAETQAALLGVTRAVVTRTDEYLAKTERKIRATEEAD